MTVEYVQVPFKPVGSRFVADLGVLGPDVFILSSLHFGFTKERVAKGGLARARVNGRDVGAVNLGELAEGVYHAKLEPREAPVFLALTKSTLEAVLVAGGDEVMVDAGGDAAGVSVWAKMMPASPSTLDAIPSGRKPRGPAANTVKRAVGAVFSGAVEVELAEGQKAGCSVVMDGAEGLAVFNILDDKGADLSVQKLPAGKYRVTLQVEPL